MYVSCKVSIYLHLKQTWNIESQSFSLLILVNKFIHIFFVDLNVLTLLSALKNLIFLLNYYTNHCTYIKFTH